MLKLFIPIIIKFYHIVGFAHSAVNRTQVAIVARARAISGGRGNLKVLEFSTRSVVGKDIGIFLHELID